MQDVSELDQKNSNADREGSPKFTFFSIASRNYICFANCLYQSLVKQYGSIRFFLALADTDTDLDRRDIQYDILSLSDLEDDRVWGMAEQYNITEFNTSIKPFVFAHLMEHYPDQPILYLDPDILAVSPFYEIEVAFSEGANAVLTPHLAEPLDIPISRDEELLKYGIYNLGFIGLRPCKEVKELLDWWCDRMEKRCLIDFPNGLFVDQKWCDFIPAYLAKTHILRHSGYNVAYWNLPSRKITYLDGFWASNGEPLRFVHFSGVSILDPTIFSRHAPFLHHSVVGEIGLLLEYYRNMVLKCGLKRYGHYNYAFRYSGASGAVNVHTAESLSDKLKGDKGLVDHPLPAFGPKGVAVANSLNEYGPAPSIKVVSAVGWFDQINWEIAEQHYHDSMRQLEDQLLRKATDVVLTGGVCAMCCTTSPFLGEVKGSKQSRVCDWGESLSCRCGHSADYRALVHAAKSIGSIGPGDLVKVVGKAPPLMDWVRLNWQEAGPNVKGHCLLAKLGGLQVSNELLHEWYNSLLPGGLLVIAGNAMLGSDGKPTPIDFLMLNRLRFAGFIDVDCLLYSSSDLGYLGLGQHLFVARTASNLNRVEKQ